MGANTSYPDKGGGGHQSVFTGSGGGGGGGGSEAGGGGTPGGGPRAGAEHRSSSAVRTFQAGPNADSGVVHRDKKKKNSKFATLRKKLIRTRRHSRSFDYAKAMRELTSAWSIRELNALVEEYEASVALKDVALLANLARPHAKTFKEDLSSLYDCKFGTDVDLVYQGVVFPVHRAFLSVRCAFFRDLLTRFPDYGAEVPVYIRTPGIDVNMFSALLRYLYTGQFRTEDAKLENMDIIMQLAVEFGTPSPLEQDMRTLLETGAHSDAVLIFASEHRDTSTPEGSSDSRSRKHELRCHKAILAARSPFFRNLLLRRARSGEELTERALQSPTCIVLDESVIPRRYARVLLHALYLDTVDLSCIVRSSVSMCSLSEVQAIVAGRTHITITDEAMEIYQIGQFLDLPILSQGCEDIIVETLSADNLAGILQWSSEPHGSHWVQLQALHFLREEFLHIAHSPVLFELNKDYMVHTLQSDFLQAGELDVLCAVLKWGEHQLMRRMEEREPNLLSHTAHSVSKKGIKKRDLNDAELREILADLLPYLRTDHIIPHNHEVLSNAIKRGLISVPPSHMLGDDVGHSAASVWVRVRNCGVFIKPRLFTPYYEEAKSLLEDQLSQVQENEVVRLRTVHIAQNIPDTLYMVEDRGAYSLHAPPVFSTSASTVDIIAGTIPVPDQETLRAMLKRQEELHQTKAAQRAYSMLYADRRALSHYIQLEVVREFGLPDSTVEVLQGSSSPASLAQREPTASNAGYNSGPYQRRVQPSCSHLHAAAHHLLQYQPAASSSSSSRQQHHLHLQQQQQQQQQQQHKGDDAGRVPSTPVTPVHSFGSLEQKEDGRSACSDGTLSDVMPDIAMATASVNQMNLHDLAPPDIELDLGDGSNQSGSGTLFI